MVVIGPVGLSAGKAHAFLFRSPFFYLGGAFATKQVRLLKSRVAIQAVGSRIGFKVCWRGGLVCECSWPPIRIAQ